MDISQGRSRGVPALVTEVTAPKRRMPVRAKRRSDDSTRAQPRELTQNAMADAYSVRARQARERQGLPPIVTSTSALSRLAKLMATTEQRPVGTPTAEASPGAA